MEKVLRQAKSVLEIIRLSLVGKESLISGSISSSIILLSIPMILEMLMESLFSVVDIFFVTRLGFEAVATVGLTESLMTLVYSLSIGIGMAATALIARRIGAGKTKKAADMVFQVLLVSVILSLLIGFLGYMYSEPVLRLLGATPEVIQMGLGYTKIIFAGNVAVTLLFVINGVFRGAGNANIAMHSLWFANIMNLVLDPILIFGLGPIPAMGLEGAAWATVIGRGLGVVYQLVFLFKGKAVLKITTDNFVFKFKTLKKIVVLSFGATGQFLIESISWIVLIAIIANFGSAMVAGYTIAYRILMFILLPGWGMANAAATLVGQNLGANKPERAEASVWKTVKYNMIIMGIISVIFLLTADLIVELFTSDINVIIHGTEALKMFCLGFVFFACGMVVSQSFNGAGDTKTPAYINILTFWVIQIPLAWFLAIPMNLQATGVYLSIAISYGIHALLTVLVFRKGKWKLVKV